jgi:hypothetical protein
MIFSSRSPVLFIFSGLILSILLVGVVSADNDPNNDSFADAEEIDVGTHSGTVGAYDESDWYKIKITSRSEFKIEAWIVAPEEYENIEIVSYDEDGLPDDQIHFYLNTGSMRDSCHFYELEEGYYQYLKVTGYGDYKMKIFLGDESNLSDWCCHASGAIGLALLMIVTAALILIRRITR